MAKGDKAVKVGRASIDGRMRVVCSVETSCRDLTDGLAGLDPPVHSVVQLIQAGRFQTGELQPLWDHAPEVLSPQVFALPLVPSKVVCLGRNYAEHARELGNAVPETPVIFNKTPNTYRADGDFVEIDLEAGRVDYEGEIALVMGIHGAVAGYTLLNDVTARDWQAEDKAKGLPWYRSKNMDSFCPIGPLIRVADSLPEIPELDIEVRLNGTLCQKGNTREFLFPIPELLGYIRRHITLEPGDLVATGTPPGVGRLQPGDTVEVVCPEIGVLRSRVRAKCASQ